MTTTLKTQVGIIGLVVVAIGLILYFLPTKTTAPTVTEESGTPAMPVDIPDLITITSPLPGETVANPVVVRGEARGTWFFEASAPVIVTNWDGLIIGQGFVMTEGEWMTEDFVPFSGTISYELPADSYSATGTIIFQKDNPSGLPEYDQAVEVVVQLSQ
ncbi:MAG: Gmad2 immunoglobulin-like domain-containing protein [Patescibacteria group bacterium]